MSAQQYSRRRAVSSLAATLACALGPISATQNQFPPARRKTAPVRFSPQQVQTPSFTAQKMAIRFLTLGKRGGKATLGSQDTVSVHSPTSIGSILHGSSSEL